MSYKYLFIDLDNTLYSYEASRAPAQAELELYLSIRLGESRSFVKKGLAKSRLEIKKRLRDTASSHSRLIYISEFLRSIGYQSEVELALSSEEVYWTTFLESISLYKGVENFLQAARHSGYRNILVTDLNSSIQYRKLRMMKIDALFDLIFTSEDAGGDKRTGLPESLLKEHLGEVSGICIGDSPFDHLFKERTSFYMKTDRGVTFGKSQHQTFSDFSRLQKRLFYPNNEIREQ